MMTTNPTLLNDSERFKEISLLLALGFLRWRQNQLDFRANIEAMCKPLI